METTHVATLERNRDLVKGFERMVEAGGFSYTIISYKETLKVSGNDYVACDPLFPRTCIGEVKTVP